MFLAPQRIGFLAERVVAAVAVLPVQQVALAVAVGALSSS
jgi:hypothetical protein